MFNHSPYIVYMANKPTCNGTAAKQRPQIPAESAASSTHNRADGFFDLRVGSMGSIVHFTWDRVKTITQIRAHVHTTGSTYKQDCKLDIQTVRQKNKPRYHDTCITLPRL